MKINIRMAAAIVGLAAIASHSVTAARGPLQTSRSVWDGVYTEEQANRGMEVYSLECSKCHAPDLSGVDEAPALAGGAFLSNWDSLTVGDLSERIRISMPPNKQGKLTRKQIVDTISYILSVNSFPAGKTEMDQRTEVLKQIKIEATKPKAGSGS
jgi:mono/diheme cytochrome c family protein